jgi:hypothetical protein
VALLALGARDAAAQSCPAPKTSCAGANGYYASKEDLDRLTGVADPILRELRACLDAAGGKAVTPGLVIRWDADGNPVSVKIDVPGYESLPCVAKASGKLSSLQNPHETAIRCEYGCGKPAPAPAPLPAPAPTTAPPPVVFLPPGATQPPPAGAAPPPPAAPAGAVPVVGRPGGEREGYTVRYEKVWYGWQGLITDGVALTFTLAGMFSRTGTLTTIGLITYGLGFPIVHMAHGDVGRGFGSIGMRVLLPLLGAGIGAIAAVAAEPRGDRGDAAGDGALVGAFIGGGGASLVDATALGYKSEKVEANGPPAARRDAPALSIAPLFSAYRGRASIGLAGRF